MYEPRKKAPEQFDRLSFVPCEELPGDDGEGAPTLELNRVYAATLAHYGALADPACVRDPNHKGTVEHAFGHSQATVLKGKRFETIEAQKVLLEHWETNWKAKRIHGTERQQVQAMFEAKRAHLLPLPLLGMQYFSEQARTVRDDSCVRVDHSSYAARPAAIGSKVLMRIFERLVEIRDLSCLTSAKRRESKRCRIPRANPSSAERAKRGSCLRRVNHGDNGRF